MKVPTDRGLAVARNGRSARGSRRPTRGKPCSAFTRPRLRRRARRRALSLGPHPRQIADPILAAAGRKEVIALRGTGAQVYTCEASPSGFAWRLKSPDATLMDGMGAEIGHHFAGPSWQASDGSTVVGEVVVSDPAPQPSSIPWLLLRAKSHSGSGAFASVGYIARIQTEGGLAPPMAAMRRTPGRSGACPTVRSTYSSPTEHRGELLELVGAATGHHETVRMCQSCWLQRRPTTLASTLWWPPGSLRLCMGLSSQRNPRRL